MAALLDSCETFAAENALEFERGHRGVIAQCIDDILFFLLGEVPISCSG